MKEMVNLKRLFTGLIIVFFLTCGLFLHITDDTSIATGLAIIFTLILQAVALKNSRGLLRKLTLLLMLGTVFYGGAEIVWFYEENITGGLTSVPFWSDVLYITNLLLLVTALALLAFSVENRFMIVYFAIDILIIYFSIITIMWVYLISPLYNQAGITYGSGVASFMYPALALLILFGLSAAMFVKKSFFPFRAMLFFTISTALFFIGDSGYVLSFYYNVMVPTRLIELFWTMGIVFQGAAALALIRNKFAFEKGKNTFDYKAGSYPITRTTINIASILLLFLIFTLSRDGLAGASLLLVIFLVYSRQLLTSAQLTQLTDSYQDLTRNLEDQVHKRTEELQRKNSELEKSTSRLKYMALHDQLTDIWNRRALEGRLKTLFEKSLEEPVEFAVIFIDIDRFKEVNDRLGHSYGDELLIEFTRRIKEEFPSGAFIARQSGDEFVVILEEASREEIESIIQRFFLANEKGYTIFGDRVKITFSLGASFFPEDSSNPDELLQAADMAMYTVKQQGKNSYQFHCG